MNGSASSEMDEEMMEPQDLMDATQRFDEAFADSSSRRRTRNVYRKAIDFLGELEEDIHGVTLDKIEQQVAKANQLHDKSAMLSREAVYDSEFWQKCTSVVKMKTAELQTSYQTFQSAHFAKKLIEFGNSTRRTPGPDPDVTMIEPSTSRGRKSRHSKRSRKSVDSNPSTSAQADDLDSDDESDFLNPATWPVVFSPWNGKLERRKKSRSRGGPSPTYADSGLDSESEQDEYLDDESKLLSCQGWVKLGRVSARILKMPPAIVPLYGKFSLQPAPPKKERKKAVFTKTLLKGVKKETVIKKVSAEDEMQTKEETSVEAEHMLKLLKRACKQNGGAVNYFQFLVCPDSFSQTLRNMFILSFLYKDGRVKFLTRTPGDLQISFVSPREAVDFPSSGSAPRQQFVFNLTFDTFRQAIRLYNIEQAIYEPLSREE